MDNVDVKQFKRSYSGGLSVNFPACFTDLVDVKTKNYSNFYLSDNILFNSGFTYGKSILPSSNIRTEIKYGLDFLQFSPADAEAYKDVDRYSEYNNYGSATFSTVTNDDTHFNLEIHKNNKCRIYFTKKYRKYYLISNTDNNISFVLEKLIPTTSDINPHDFDYMFSEATNSMLFFKRTETTNYILIKYGNSLVLQPNIITYLSTPFVLSRSIFTTVNATNNTSFIAYTNSNQIDKDNSIFDLKNNILLHKPLNGSILSPIILKNQLLQGDVFSCANTLLTSGPISEHSADLREYTSIFEDITEENTDELELNYVFYNKHYRITPGSTLVLAPSSIFPYSTLNINDTTFKYSGSFAYPTPQYADKVYHISKDENLEAQYILCTWLSGSPSSSDNIWIDRYYYPDLIEKEAAITAYGPISPTYDDYIESLINSNSELEESVTLRKFFDKKSDLTFSANETYLYERISTTIFPSLSSAFTFCTGFNATQPVNYFKTINKANKYTIGFYFDGDAKNWTVQSERNALDSGISISKTGQTLIITLKIFDSSNGTTTTWTESGNIKSLKNNFVLCSVDGITGESFFFLNTSIIKSFEIPRYQYIYKQLLYGDFFIYQGDVVTNLLEETTYITTPYIIADSTDQNLAFIKPMIDGKMAINDIYIALPCGMRNSSDNIEHLQSASGSSLFKSNKVNIIIKNTDITNADIQAGLIETLTNNLIDVPVNSELSEIKFENNK